MSTGAALVRPGSLKAWMLAARPKTLPAAMAPVLVGTACAWHEHALRLGPVAAALVGAVLLQIAANLANDLFDFQKGADTSERLGPLRAAQAGLLTAAQLRRGLVLVLLAGVAVGLYLISMAGPVLLVIGLASMVSAVAYTAGPYPLGYLGLGDIFVFVFFGPVAVGGTVLASAGRVPELAWWLGVPQGLLATAILVVNNLRDAPQDAGVGKRTLAVRFGERFAVGEYFAVLGLSFAVPVLLVAAGRIGWPGLLPLVIVPWALSLGGDVARVRGRALNDRLARTAFLMLIYSLLMSLGLVLDTPSYR